MTPIDLQNRLKQFPRLSYFAPPTPLEPLPRLSQRLGGPRLWIKRDDGIGPAFGGNKGRKLEFLMADIERRGRHKVITYGGLQSNHARMTAAACAARGLTAHLFFFERRPVDLRGNLLLDQLCGAHLHFIPFGGGGGSLTLEMTNWLVRLVSFMIAGPGAYFIPVGGHNVTGCLGYVDGARELHEQLVARGLPPGRTTIVTPAGTGGTLAGIVAGLALLDSPMRVLGLDIGKLWKGFPSSVARLATALCLQLGTDRTFSAEEIPLIEKTYAGAGYGAFTRSTAAAIRSLAQAEGIILDPVYTGKAFAGLLDLVQGGQFGEEDHIVFLHTGGLPALWEFAAQLRSASWTDPIE